MHDGVLRSGEEPFVAVMSHGSAPLDHRTPATDAEAGAPSSSSSSPSLPSMPPVPSGGGSGSATASRRRGAAAGAAHPPSPPSDTSPGRGPRRPSRRASFAFGFFGSRFRGGWLPIVRLPPVRSGRDAADLLADAAGWLVERAVYALGPILIVLALSIAGLLTYAFATVLVPMWQDKYRSQPLYVSGVALAAHGLFVAFLLWNVLFNYYFCVVTPHTGPHYDAVVRELADATGLAYPETPDEVDAFRCEFEDKMVLRMRRRQARALEQQQQLQQQRKQLQTPLSPAVPQPSAAPNPAPPDGAPSAPLPNGTATNGAGHAAATSAPAPSVTLPPLPPPSPVRRWMLLGPYEWGFCGHSLQPKPPRSHYDHVSKQLVLNLDHYCPWMFNAIGYFNYRYFVNFLFYVFLSMSYGALVTAEPFLWIGTAEYKRQFRLDRKPPDLASSSTTSTYALSHQSPPARLVPMLPFAHERMILSLSFMLCVAVGLAVLLLGGFHAYLVCTAQTTVEFHANWTLRRRDPSHRNPYSLGSWRRNFAQVYGSAYASPRPRRPWWTALGPSTRPPDALPVPVPGRPGAAADSFPRRRAVAGRGKDQRPYAAWEV